jgi:hypothetical protein
MRPDSVYRQALARYGVRAMGRAMKACQRVLLAVTVEGRNVGHVGRSGT